MKKVIFFIITTILLFGYEVITPHKKITYDYYISKIAFNNKYLIAGLENGSIIIKNFNNLKTLITINLPKIHDFMGDKIPMPIYSIDISPDNKEVLILTEDENAKRTLFIYNLNTKTLKKIFTINQTLMKANFIDNKKIFFAKLSDEITLYDLTKKKFIYTTQLDSYVFSTYALNNDKTKIALGDESGNIKIANTITGKKIATIIGFNKDKTLSLDYQKNEIINASNDKRVGIYTENGKIINTLDAKFLPYAAALSPTLKTFAIQYDEKNNIMVYSQYNKPLYLLKGHTMPLNGMKYINSTTLISYSPSEILIWKIKE
ncbi:nitrate reductase [Caminibacter mediatlanticus TB-2]|uniref:Nitrate reductase n=1 Tax=Caminibacter mediatlanticus TB-2 TaxID=391592 RepID=A0ABX5VBN2_9BACT|nr:nitrate reductase [Caminibacter mediatlanticus]QCT94359.1 nitrate reductase [Caminibacter mediatlanticus TB-2]